MDYRLWQGYMPGSDYAFGEQVEGLSYEQDTQLLLGERLAEPLPVVRVTKLTPGKRPDTLDTASAARLVAPNVRAALEACCAETIQFLPAKVSRYPRTDYVVVNVLARADLFDRKQSEFDTLSGEPEIVSRIRRLVLKPIPEGTPGVVHVTGLPGTLLVRDDVREALEAASRSPGTFVPVEEYREGQDDDES
jgi:hypothetical protein